MNKKNEEIFCNECGIEILTVDKVLHHGLCTSCYLKEIDKVEK